MSPGNRPNRKGNRPVKYKKAPTTTAIPPRIKSPRPSSRSGSIFAKSTPRAPASNTMAAGETLTGETLNVLPALVNPIKSIHVPQKNTQFQTPPCPVHPTHGCSYSRYSYQDHAE